MKRLNALYLFLALLLSGGLFSALPATAQADPVGTVISYYGTAAPDGYFICNGETFDADTYPKLHAVLGSNVLPDLRGYFVRGYDTRNTVDPDGAGRALGSVQGDAIRNITGSLGWVKNRLFSVANGVFEGINNEGVGQAVDATGSSIKYSNANFDASRVVPTAPENRPKNKNLLYCIKHDEKEVPPIVVPEKASIDESVAGTDDVKYVTPAGVAAAIAAHPAPAPVIPDLRLNQETLWPTRYEGKQVYAKLINFGALPAAYGLRATTHGIQDVDWIQISWDYSVIRKNNDANKVTLGLVSTPPPTLSIQWRFLVDKTSVQAHSLVNASSSDWNAIICILYTKTTDQPVNP